MKERVLAGLLIALSASAVLAQEAPAKAPPTPSRPAAKTSPAPAGPSEAESKAAKPAATETSVASEADKPTKDNTGTPQRFIPSEQVRSDFDVSFPVDI